MHFCRIKFTGDLREDLQSRGFTRSDIPYAVALDETFHEVVFDASVLLRLCENYEVDDEYHPLRPKQGEVNVYGKIHAMRRTLKRFEERWKHTRERLSDNCDRAEEVAALYEQVGKGG